MKWEHLEKVHLTAYHMEEQGLFFSLKTRFSFSMKVTRIMMMTTATVANIQGTYAQQCSGCLIIPSYRWTIKPILTTTLEVGTLLRHRVPQKAAHPQRSESDQGYCLKETWTNKIIKGTAMELFKVYLCLYRAASSNKGKMAQIIRKAFRGKFQLCNHKQPPRRAYSNAFKVPIQP